MKTKTQKTEQLTETRKRMGESETLIIADFTGLSVNSLNNLRKSLKESGIIFGVVKKRLLKIIFGEEGIDADPKKFQGQAGVAFSPLDISETARIIYKFAKSNKENFKLSGGVELKEKKFLEGKEVEYIGKLPGREVLLGQLVGMIAAPLKTFLFVLNERSKVDQQK